MITVDHNSYTKQSFRHGTMTCH